MDEKISLPKELIEEIDDFLQYIHNAENGSIKTDKLLHKLRSAVKEDIAYQEYLYNVVYNPEIMNDLD